MRAPCSAAVLSNSALKICTAHVAWHQVGQQVFLFRLVFVDRAAQIFGFQAVGHSHRLRLGIGGDQLLFGQLLSDHRDLKWL